MKGMPESAVETVEADCMQHIHTDIATVAIV